MPPKLSDTLVPLISVDEDAPYANEPSIYSDDAVRTRRSASRITVDVPAERGRLNTTMSISRRTFSVGRRNAITFNSDEAVPDPNSEPRLSDFEAVPRTAKVADIDVCITVFEFSNAKCVRDEINSAATFKLLVNRLKARFGEVTEDVDDSDSKFSVYGDKQKRSPKTSISSDVDSSKGEKATQQQQQQQPDKQPQNVMWVHMHKTNEPALRNLARMMRIHVMALEDSLTGQHRPKLEVYDRSVFMLLRTLVGSRWQQVSLFLCKHNCLLSCGGAPTEVFPRVLELVENSGSRIRINADASFLLSNLVDSVVIQCFQPLNRLDETLSELEAVISLKPSPALMHEVHLAKRELAALRRIMWPTREAIFSLDAAPTDLVSDHARVYLRSAYDHAVQLIDLLETFREMTVGLMELYTTSLNFEMDKIMKVLTLVQAIFVPLTFLCGVFGMNFKHKMWELDWEYGYYCFWCLCAFFTCTQLAIFRFMNWV
eukprot:m.15687 g.15687  ORF g.15687 m.15687 type:complete len:486 (+) comp7444_c0_seq2:231-1688(+)